MFASLKIPWSAPARLSSGPILHLGDLPTQLQQQGLEARRATAAAGDPGNEAQAGGAPEVKTLADLERDAILAAIRTLKGDKLQAAKAAGHRQDHTLPEAERVRHRRPAARRVTEDSCQLPAPSFSLQGLPAASAPYLWVE